MQHGGHYSGSSSHRLVDKLINGPGRELLVVSPYIDNYYARVLLRASKRKRVRVITSPDALAYKRSFLKTLHIQRMKGYVKPTMYFAILSAIVLYLRFYYVAIPIIALAVLLLALMLMSLRNRALQLKVIERPFVHEKLYICNGTAVTGSANLTYKGMHMNVEHVDSTNDKKQVSALQKHFEELWHRDHKRRREKG